MPNVADPSGLVYLSFMKLRLLLLLLLLLVRLGEPAT